MERPGQPEPAGVFHYFSEICSIPHGSGNIAEISKYCVDFANRQGLRYRQDQMGNVVIWKDASEGYHSAEPVILQGHLDMVCVKEPGCMKDMDKEGLSLKSEGDYMFAESTSLGADDGIAIAIALALLSDKMAVHPPIEAVFTVDEEIGMLGASAFDASDLKGHTFINIDSEEEGIFVAGCAGGATVCCIVPVEKEVAQGVFYRMSIEGLSGGHSGTEIHKGHANANQLFGRFLLESFGKIGIRMQTFHGGEKDNAIARYFYADLMIENDEADGFEQAVADFEQKIKKEYAFTDPDMQISVKKGKQEHADVYSEKTFDSVRSLLIHLPGGVQAMMPEMEGIVQASLNLGVAEERDGEARLTFSVRSALLSQKEMLIRKIQHLTEMCGASCTVEGEYPAWEYSHTSRLRDTMSSVWEEMSGQKPKIEIIHAGLECGIFASKIQPLDCISIGPEIQDIHTTREKLSISSTERIWDLLSETLRRLK